MITQIRGKLVEKNPTYAVVDCNGVGYLLNISLNTYGALPADENVLLYSYLAIREDAHTLYGFINKMEREVFKLLISVSGVGASTARTMLSSMTSEEMQFDIDEVSATQSNTNKEEALSALEVLGFARKQTDKVLNTLLKSTPDATVESLIKQALKNL